MSPLKKNPSPPLAIVLKAFFYKWYHRLRSASGPGFPFPWCSVLPQFPPPHFNPQALHWPGWFSPPSAEDMKQASHMGGGFFPPSVAVLPVPLADSQAAASSDGGENHPGQGKVSWQKSKPAGSNMVGEMGEERHTALGRGGEGRDPGPPAELK